MKSGLGLPLALSILTHLTVMLPLALFGKNTVLPERSLEVVLVHSIDNGRGSDAAVQKSETLRNFKARKDAHVKNKMPSSAKLHPVKERGLHHEGIVESDKSRKADMMSVHEVNADDDREGGQPISTRSSSVDLDIGAGNGSEGMGQDGEQYDNPGSSWQGGLEDGALPVLPAIRKPEYPRRSRELGEEGTVVLLVEVFADRRPVEIKIISSSGYPRLDKAAVKAIESAVLALPSGKAFLHKKISFNFRLEEQE